METTAKKFDWLPTRSYRIGMPVRVYHHLWQSCLDGEVVSVTAEFLTVTIKQLSPGLTGPVIVTSRQVRPLLRKLDTLTESEARVCYQLYNGFAFDPSPPFKGAARRKALVEMTAREYLGFEESDFGQVLRGVTVVDYLDSIGIDTRNWIDKGLAIDKATVDPTIVKQLV